MTSLGINEKEMLKAIKSVEVVKALEVRVAELEKAIFTKEIKKEEIISEPEKTKTSVPEETKTSVPEETKTSEPENNRKV